MNKSGDVIVPNRQKYPAFLETMVIYHKENIQIGVSVLLFPFIILLTRGFLSSCKF